jgi:tRNA nucleotidyltransferase (CCA-adding enzyme)
MNMLFPGHLPEEALRICEAVRKYGGRAFIVGGWIRDAILEKTSKDIDIEVYNLNNDMMKTALSEFGEVELVGKAFGVFKVAGCDVSMPRKDSKIAPGHKGFEVNFDPLMSRDEAARRRDFTCNSMFYDPVDGGLYDPYHGQDDIKAGILKVVDPTTFIEDPLRVLRAAQFIARFGFKPDAGLLKLSASIAHTMKELPGERLLEEWNKLLLKGKTPSKGIEFLRDVGVLSLLFPEIHALIDVKQEFEWHPEGDVFIHTNMAIDAATESRTGDVTHDMTLMYATLCHDFGKSWTTKFEEGRWRARGHEEAGVEPAMAFLGRLKAPADLMKQVAVLVNHHLAPAHFMAPKQKATPKAYRTLARKLDGSGTNVEMLYKVAKADHFGRTTPDALAREFPAGDEFLAKAKEIKVEDKPEPDVVMGRHLLARGMAPGKEFGIILTKCREIQYETGIKDPEEILKQVLV